MANNMRWRYGETSPVMMPVDAGTVIEIGDLLYLATDDVRPAGVLTPGGSLAATQEAFHDNFVGVAMQCSPAGVADPIRVATTGVFEFDCVSATFDVGDFVGGNNGGGGELDNQLVDEVATPNLAVGRCVKRVSPAGTKVLVDVVSTLVKGGPQAMA
ncbi:MAG: capsid cement protein [Bythopirellula sp.]|nr:capsid cement protein [Bythopirellula sp.]